MTERGVAGSWPSVAVVVPNHSRIDESIVEALDGRLFGPLERIVRVLLFGWWHTTVGWTGPRRLVVRVHRLQW
ncbi:MAG: hypothetical protein CL466_07980 [Acidimicrobiaceae bacterium]|nr:hypothetical protein [Acidimicrobiaceae bacterium]|tara:strand:+ start:257 stop:475 length:219 start_codon:yes stop_codon:yes gene_type:complete